MFYWLGTAIGWVAFLFLALIALPAALLLGEWLDAAAAAVQAGVIWYLLKD